MSKTLKGVVVFIKKKHLQVIAFSSVIITVVLATTLSGYMIYIQWKNDSFSAQYRRKIYKLTAELFREKMPITNAIVIVDSKENMPGRKSLFEGTLKNNSSKTVTSVLVELSFMSSDGTILYKDWFCPIGERKDLFPSFSGERQMERVIVPGEMISFRHVLRNFPVEIVSRLSTKQKFAKDEKSDEITLEYSIAGMSAI